ncbi:hypothetical protein Syun_002516 [Stephania yunnanensis]|uniref:Fe2OG dioxygenase domain-containing protein n=1 Tax=Stephania yunnanensis TaxID=152371 RepID=A0AAP0LFX2_9MAGN
MAPTPAALTTTPTSTTHDFAKEVKDFDDSKMGVKDLLDSGVTTIPKIFMYPPEILADLKPCNLEIPTIDLSHPREEVIEQIKRASHDWGFYQIINHGISNEVIDQTINAFKSFYELPMEAKKKYHHMDPKVAFYSNFNIFHSKAVNWKDSLRVFMAPNPPEMDQMPSVCAKELLDWDIQAKRVAEELMEMMCEGVGVKKDKLKEMSCLEHRKLLSHYYPYCPQPDLTMGLPPHTDRGVLTVLLQNEVNGLHVKHGTEWVEVKPVRGALIINVGDLLQIFSNDAFTSVEHRVVANPSKNPRISLAAIYNPGKRGENDVYGVFPEIITPEKPSLYKEFTIPEIQKQGLTGDSSCRAIIDLFKLDKSEAA